MRIESVTATQVWDGNVIKYSSTGNKVKETSEGIGVSMNLKNDATQSIISTQ